MVGLQGLLDNRTVKKKVQLVVCVTCLLLWASSYTTGCAGLYFYAHDYSSWVNTVMVFRNTTIAKNLGALQMNPYINATVGRALYKTTFPMRNSKNDSLASFNTSFVFSMNTDRANQFYGDGLAFLICPNAFTGDDVLASSGGYLGMFNSKNLGKAKNKIFAVEFDTHQNMAFKDPDDNHMGVDVNTVTSLETKTLSSLGIILNDDKKIVCWIDYNGHKKSLWVYLAHAPSGKPSKPAISMTLDLSPYINEKMYVGFSAATGTRAELHTVYSWWFLSGFSSNLTIPVSSSSSPSSSHWFLASLGKRSSVIAVFTLAAFLSFLYCFCLLAQRRWQKRSKHLIHILLPVACWMYWKESMTLEACSMQCFKLATPPAELLAWLWRTRWARRHELVTWRERLLKRKMGSTDKGEAWQLENGRKRKRRKRHGALHVVVYEEPAEEDNLGDGKMPRGMKVIKHIRMGPAHEMKDKKEAAVPSMSEKQRKRYMIENDSYIVLNEETDAKIFQRRGSFLVPQGASDDHQEFAGRHTALDPEAVQMSTKEAYRSDKFYTRRGSFSVHPDGSMSVQASEEGKEQQPWVHTVMDYDSKISPGRVLDGRRGSFSVHPEDAGGFISMHASHEDKPHACYTVEEDNLQSSSGRVFNARRGSFSMHADDASGVISVQPSVSHTPHVQYVVEHEGLSSSGRLLDARRGSFSLHPEDSTGLDISQARPSAQFVGEDGLQSPSGRDFAARRGPFSLHPEDGAIEQTDVDAPKEGKPGMQHVVEHESNSSSSKVFDARRGSFIVDSEGAIEFTHKRALNRRKPHMQDVVEHETSSHPGRVSDAIKGSFIMQSEDAMEYARMRASREGQGYALRHPDDGHDVAISSGRARDARHASFMILEEASPLSRRERPAGSDQSQGSPNSMARSPNSMAIHNQSVSDWSPSSLPLNRISRGDDGSTSHVTHQWPFD